MNSGVQTGKADNNLVLVPKKGNVKLCLME